MNDKELRRWMFVGVWLCVLHTFLALLLLGAILNQLRP
jgi:hypothetical protein